MSPDSTYAELIKLKARLKEKAESLSTHLQNVEQQLNSVTLTLELLGHRGKEEYESELVFPPDEIKGLTHHEALERIAQANGNRLRIVDAKRVLVAAGMISTPKNAYSILSNTISRVGKFRKVGAGEYELPREERPLLAESATHR